MATRRQPPDGNSPDFSFLGETEQSETADDSLSAGGTVELAAPAVDDRRDFQANESEIKSRPVDLDKDVAEAGSMAESSSVAAVDQRRARPKRQMPVTETKDIGGIGGARLSGAIVGYAIGLTCLFLFLLVTGRISLFGGHPLESLPDIRPLQPNEFQKIPDGAALPENHVLELGQSQRFGDVVVTPTKITREPLQFQGFLSGEVDAKMTTGPVLKLWIQFENVADDYAFVPFDVGLMSHRSPPASTDVDVLVNSFLTSTHVDGDDQTSDANSSRILNYLHSADSNFVIVGQNAGQLIPPGESVTVFVASSETPETRTTARPEDFTWRVQFRKGVNTSSGHGVTTLVDVRFPNSAIADVSSEPSAEPAKAVTSG